MKDDNLKLGAQGKGKHQGKGKGKYQGKGKRQGKGKGKGKGKTINYYLSAVLYCCGLQFVSPDFLLDQMTSHILNKSSSLLLSIQTISSIGLAWIGNTQLSTEVFLKLSLNSAQTFKDVELVALLNATFR